MSRFEEVYAAIRKDIFVFCKVLHFEPSPQQAKLLKAVQNGCKRIAVKSGQGPGKTAATAIIGLWRAIRHKNARVVITAPTMRQCKDVWLAEARLWLDKADPILRKLIHISKTKVEIAKQPDWGIKLMTATHPENAQGIHNEHLTFIVEEASGIPRPLITQIEGTLSQASDDSLFIQIGNPNSRDCAFFDCFNSRRNRWECFTWNAEESSNVSTENLRYLEEVYGRESDVYRVRVLGEFPHTDPNCIISSDDLEKCVDKRTIYRQVKELRFGRPVKQFGIDFARFGSDESAIYQRSGYAIVNHRLFNRTEVDTVVNYCFKLQLENSWKDSDTLYVADASGMGQGIMHKFYAAQKRIYEFYSAGSPYSAQYENRITEAWFDLARLVKTARCYLPRDNVLIQQLTSRQYYVTKQGKIIIETKEDYVKRGFESPDRADGVVMAFYDKAALPARISNVSDSPKRVGIEV